MIKSTLHSVETSAEYSRNKHPKRLRNSNYQILQHILNAFIFILPVINMLYYSSSSCYNRLYDLSYRRIYHIERYLLKHVSVVHYF